ncbi:GTPase domain-containing protein [Aquibacillus saliphilus]|uniref:GTPase domain-containing protein n=1 Tax=Aquibacillus saliphilus TaxID=1909422 RepID=UPI001CEFFECB|nr:GTPase domain-containing protein [Aquibacillus saliphilus]
MTLEKQLINKSYYETFMEGNENVHPIKVLGELYMDEQQNEVTYLSYIRFAQGEIYFLNKDFEAAIFKWENISNELRPWAQKNIADAHYKMELLAIAEEAYKEVETDSIDLKTEVLLQLFSLYIQNGKLDMAVGSIKNAVDLNPDYSEVTEMARAFFEQHQDFGNAVELAVKEAIRTESPSWFGILQKYVEQGYTQKVDPNYFSEALMTVYSIDQSLFKSLTVAFWNSYKQSDLYFSWLKEINHLLLNIEPERSFTWEELTLVYEETYFKLINGKLLIREVSHLIPNHLTNWLKLSTDSGALVSASAVLAWNEIFPSNLDTSLVNEAESMVSQSSRYHNGTEDGFRLFESIINWAEGKGVFLDERFELMARELPDMHDYRLLVSGTATNGKSEFINTLLDEDLLDKSTSAAVLFKDADEANIQAITGQKVRSIDDLDDFRESTKDEQALIHCRMPISFLNENKLELMDIPGLADRSKVSKDMVHYLHFADSLLFVLDAELPLTDKELDRVVNIREQAPELTIHFLLSKMDRIANSQEKVELVETTTAKISTYFPDAKVFAFSAYDNSSLVELSGFVQSLKRNHNLELERTAKVLYFVKESIKFLLEERVEMEKLLIDKIKWNEEIVTKLKGTLNQLSDMEEEKVQVIKNSYSNIKDDLRQDLMENIPTQLRNCSEIVHEDSDFGRMHVDLNDEMNKRITNYIDTKVLPNFHLAIKTWIAESEGAFKERQLYLDEMSESFNDLYGAEKLALNCDFRVLDDWRRDADRMTRGNTQLDKVNIVMRSTPSQFLMKSAGRLFGAMQQNKEMLHNKYKQFIENKDYSGTAELITNNFMQQFDLFEKSLERDINMFFKDPIEVLNRTLAETYDEIEENRDSLNDMRKNPEVYRDPLTMFEVQLRQYEWMTAVGEQMKEYR